MTMPRDAAVLLTFVLLVLPVTLALASVFTDHVDAAAITWARFMSGLATKDHAPTGGVGKAVLAGLASREFCAWACVYVALVAVAFIPGPHGEATCTDREYS